MVALKRKIHIAGTLKLVLALAAIASYYIADSSSWDIRIIIFVIYAIPFIILMVYQNRLFAKHKQEEILLELNKNELKALDYDFSAFDGADEEKDASHSYSLDLDLFGNHSLFQAINRTVTKSGKEELIKWMKEPNDKKESILECQEVVKELSTRPEQFQHFYVSGKSQNYEENNTLSIKEFIEEGININSRIWTVISAAIPALWLILIYLTAMHIIQEQWLGLYFSITIIIAYWKNRSIGKQHNSADKLEHVLISYSDLIKHAEESTYRCRRLIQLQQTFSHNGSNASTEMKKLSKLIGALNQRFSLAGILLNILMLRDIRQIIAFDKWKRRNKPFIAAWIDSLAKLDAYYSLGQFAFNHPNYVYPNIADSYFEMKGKNIGHPLMNHEVCIKNDINVPANPWFLIITGANMAGKSTYLRTIGSNYLFACIGLPVCADELSIYPAHLVTSLRTSDSLAGNESYFFAELKRLKMIIDRLNSGEKLFIILDEILKGTNSIDKQKGSMALMKRLIADGACGIIATHDLVLGTLEEEFPDKVKNYCFEADIKDGKLSFTYKMREGIARNMNASYLIQKLLDSPIDA